MQKNNKLYIVMVKMTQNKPDLFCNSLNKCVEKPVSEDAQIKCGFKVAGPWNYSLWLEAANDDAATRFAKEKIRAIDGVTETTIMSAAPLELHITGSKRFIPEGLNVEVPNYFWTGPT